MTGAVPIQAGVAETVASGARLAADALPDFDGTIGPVSAFSLAQEARVRAIVAEEKAGEDARGRQQLWEIADEMFAPLASYLSAPAASPRCEEPSPVAGAKNRRSGGRPMRPALRFAVLGLAGGLAAAVLLWRGRWNFPARGSTRAPSGSTRFRSKSQPSVVGGSTIVTEAESIAKARGERTADGLGGGARR